MCKLFNVLLTLFFVSVSTEESKNVLIAITIGAQSMFLPEFFQKVENLEFPKKHLYLHITIQNGTKFDYVKTYWKQWKSDYASIKYMPSANAAKAKQEAIHYAQNFKVDYVFFLNSNAHLEEPDVLQELIKAKKQVIAPFLKTYEKFSYARRLCFGGQGRVVNDSHSFHSLVTQKGLRHYNYDKILIGSNFLTQDVLEARNVSKYDHEAYWITVPKRNNETTPDFTSINDRTKCCLVEVESVIYAYLVDIEVFPERDYRKLFEHVNMTTSSLEANALADSIFSNQTHAKKYVLNDKTYGQLVNVQDFPLDKLHPELTRIFQNHDLWERRYIQEDVIKTTTKDPNVMPEILPKDTVKPGHCPDTYHMPILTQQFAEEWIEEAEFFDTWFSSGNEAVYDDRNGRQENVPTTDINLWQYGLEQTWLAFINYYLYPRKCTFFPGHPGLDPGGHFFTVRYRAEEQPALKPHHDNSLFSINVALNQIGQDFEGGGTHFLRQNCSDLTMDIGTILAHPGRVTHFHEGLPTTSGTRYILVSFINSCGACFERNGVPFCWDYELVDINEAQRHVQIARLNEGYNKAHQPK